MSDIDIRPVTVDERRRATDTLRAALLTGAVNDEHFESNEPSWEDSDSFAAWDGDRCIGHAAAYRLDSTVPGGARVPTAGVTRVGVLPTHTRRGVLTRLMDPLLRGARQRGQVLATLHASETPIYHRFGFGLATEACSALVTPRTATPWRATHVAGTVRLLDHGEVRHVVPDLYETAARWRVGTVSRPEWKWATFLDDAATPTTTRFGRGTFVAVHTGELGHDDGYVLYDVGWDEPFATNPTGVGTVRDLWGATPAVELELWRFLLGIDLVVEWKARRRPIDEPIRRAMHDSRAYETRSRFDEQWLRILDVDAALRERRFADGAPDISLRVVDPLFADNCGMWTLSSAGALRNDTTGHVDLTVGVATLSAAYLGGVSWHDLATSGSIAGRPDTDLLNRLDAHFAAHRAPFCGTMY